MSRIQILNLKSIAGDFKYLVHTLSNGIRLIYVPNRSPITYTAVFINTGSRDELAHEHGLAHLIEHVIFKGTTKRKAHHIIGRIENVGGELNAYTTKEETCIHAAFFNEYLERSWELIADIIFHASFPEHELEKEKSIIVDEINSFRDNPAELIFDDFDQRLFRNSSLGRNILGTPENLQQFKRNDLFHFIDRTYHTDEMVISIVGDYKTEKLIRLAEKYFSVFPSNFRSFRRQKPDNTSSFNEVILKDLSQSHCIIGTQAYGYENPKRLALLLLNDLLGGPGMNSRLNVALRERRGYAYNIESAFVSYSDTGIFSVYFGCDHQKLEKCISIVLKELEILRNNKLSDIKLHVAKRQLLGQLAISVENNENLMLAMGKSMLVYNHFDSLIDIAQKLDSVNSSMIIDVANEIFEPNKLCTLVYH
ncbi:MAG: insulinase family protein [Bacteroidales bacterium]|nr:insulinase family protein [Bacteroidales bacterium]